MSFIVTFIAAVFVFSAVIYHVLHTSAIFRKG